MNADVSPAMGEALEGARRATANAPPIAPPDPEVAATARRRQFTSAERTRILSAADACKVPGEIGALLRREGIYSSLLATWRKQRALAQRSALESQKRGPKADPLLAQKQGMAQLTRDNERLRRQLAHQASTVKRVSH